MNPITSNLQEIARIRRLMEQSSRFISLSGLAGIFVGTVALIGTLIAFFGLNYDQRYFGITLQPEADLSLQAPATLSQLILLALAVLFVSVGGSILFTPQKARKKELPLWNSAARRMLGHLLLPLAAGGLFILILLYHQLFLMIAPVTLIFYGLALVNASKFTLPEIAGLGVTQIIIGLLGAFFAGYGLLFWAAGFGLLHIGYGVFMYYRHER